MSFIYSRALVEESLQVNCLAVDAYAPLNLIPTPRPSSSLARTTAPFLRSRFGMTFEPLTDDHGAELLMSWLAGFRVRTLVQPAPAMVSKASEAGSGQKWRASFAKYDHAESKWKTPQCSLLGDSDEFSETWPRWGSMRNGVSYLRPIPALPICGSGSGLWPTPVASDTSSRTKRYAQGGTPLSLAVKLWPTPTVCGNYNRPGASKNSGMGLASAVKLWPTPTAGNDKSGGYLAEWGGSGARKTMAQLVPQEQMFGPLNPEWVEWLMGWPIGFTDLKPLETDRYQEWLQQHGIYSASKAA